MVAPRFPSQTKRTKLGYILPIPVGWVGIAVIYKMVHLSITGAPFNNLALFEDPSSSLTHEWCEKTDGFQYFCHWIWRTFFLTNIVLSPP